MRFPLVMHDLGMNAMKLDGRKIEGKSAQQGPSLEPFQGLTEEVLSRFPTHDTLP